LRSVVACKVWSVSSLQRSRQWLLCLCIVVEVDGCPKGGEGLIMVDRGGCVLLLLEGQHY
jgi:hypothetical protein